MITIRRLLLLVLAASTAAGAVVIRHDVDDARYRIADTELPALADLPGEGHGVLIAPRWVVTAAHAVSSAATSGVRVGGTSRKVERVVVHPGYRRLPATLVDEAVATGDSSAALAFLAASDDIALIELAEPVAGIAPLRLYRRGDEAGQTVTLIGKGATGDGVDGQAPDAAHRTRLRRAYNVVTEADARWLSYVFDAPASGLPLEGITGSGDSGGPLIIEADGVPSLAGLASWNRYADSTVRAFHAGLYGQVVFNVRISRYAGWIDGVISAQSAPD